MRVRAVAHAEARAAQTSNAPSPRYELRRHRGPMSEFDEIIMDGEMWDERETRSRLQVQGWYAVGIEYNTGRVVLRNMGRENGY